MDEWLAIHLSLTMLTFCVNYNFSSRFYFPRFIYARRQHFHHFRCQRLPFQCSLAMNVYFLSILQSTAATSLFLSLLFAPTISFTYSNPLCMCMRARVSRIFKLFTVFCFIDLRAYTNTQYARTTKENSTFKSLRKVLDTILYLHPIDDLKQFNRSWKPEDFTQEINDKMTSFVVAFHSSHYHHH